MSRYGSGGPRGGGGAARYYHQYDDDSGGGSGRGGPRRRGPSHQYEGEQQQGRGRGRQYHSNSYYPPPPDNGKGGRWGQDASASSSSAYQQYSSSSTSRGGYRGNSRGGGSHFHHQQHAYHDDVGGHGGAPRGGHYGSSRGGAPRGRAPRGPHVRDAPHGGSDVAMGAGAEGGRHGPQKARRGGSGPQHRQWHKSKMFCFNYAFEECSFGENCRFVHELRRVCSVPEAHADGIYCCGVNQTDNSIEIYTGAKDLHLKRWVARPSESTRGLLTVTLENSLPFDSQVTACFYKQNCLFTGHSDGRIRVMLRSGQDFILEGHKAEITVMTLVDDVLVTADYDGVLKLWQQQQTAPASAATEPVMTMTCKYTHALASSVVSLREVEATAPASLPASAAPSAPPTLSLALPGGAATTSPAPPPPTAGQTAAGAEVPTRMLWVGCRGALVIFDLASLQVYRTLEFGHEAQHTVMDILRFEEKVIACKFDGEVAVYTAHGDLIDSAHIGRWICAVDGVIGVEGPLLVCGMPEGQFAFVSLPSLEEYGVPFKAHTSDVRVVRNVGGTPSYFLSCGMDGALHVWQWARDDGV